MVRILNFAKKSLLKSEATTYVITYHAFNHTSFRHNFKPLDSRFLKSDKNYAYYLIDKEVPEVLKGKSVLQEQMIDPLLFEAGAKYFAEWSFLLAEKKHQFCSYPFFTISSRFYEKNAWLYRSLDEEWDQLFAYLEHYGWGWLPSYNSPMNWINMEWEKKIKKEVWRYQFFPFKEKFFYLLEDLYQIRIPKDFSQTANLFCNYIGFKSRKELCEYVDFYLPFINYFFDEYYQPKRDFNEYVRPSGHFRNEKPFTFLLEWISHLFFYATQKPYIALHYDGYYEVDEAKKSMKQIVTFDIPLMTRLERNIRWRVRKSKSQGFYAQLRSHFLKS